MTVRLGLILYFRSSIRDYALRELFVFLILKNGYVGLGTDWSNVTGGATYIGWTHDGGATWETTPVAVENG